MALCPVKHNLRENKEGQNLNLRDRIFLMNCRDFAECFELILFELCDFMKSAVLYYMILSGRIFILIMISEHALNYVFDMAKYVYRQKKESGFLIVPLERD